MSKFVTPSVQPIALLSCSVCGAVGEGYGWGFDGEKPLCSTCAKKVMEAGE